jgi:hypothetical protein
MIGKTQKIVWWGDQLFFSQTVIINNSTNLMHNDETNYTQMSLRVFYRIKFRSNDLFKVRRSKIININLTNINIRIIIWN